MGIARKFAQLVLKEIEAITGLQAEILDLQLNSVAGDSRAQKYYNELHMQPLNEGCKLLESSDEREAAMACVIHLRSEAVCILVLYGPSKEQLSYLQKPIITIVEMLFEKELEQGSAKYLRNRKTAVFAELLQSKACPEGVERRAQALGVNLCDPYVITVLTICQKEYKYAGLINEFPDDLLEYLLGALETYSGNRDENIIIDSKAEIVIITPTKDPAGIKTWLGGILRKACGKFKTPLCAGISRATEGCEEIYDLYRMASSICRIVTFKETPGIYCQSELSLELLIENMPWETKCEYVNHIFKDCADADIDEWDRIVTVLHKNNGSINKSAEELYMHKNTLQYRLNRIKERIGFDARKAMEAFPLQMAFLVRNSVRMANSEEMHP